MENENALSTMNMQMEAFYASVKDADYLIYNSTIDGELKSLNELLAKSVLLADFKAVKEGNVWCTERIFFRKQWAWGYDSGYPQNSDRGEPRSGRDGLSVPSGIILPVDHCVICIRRVRTPPQATDGPDQVRCRETFA